MNKLLPIQGDVTVFDKPNYEEKEYEEFMDQQDRERFVEHAESTSKCPACGKKITHMTAWAIDHGFLTCKDHDE